MGKRDKRNRKDEIWYRHHCDSARLALFNWVNLLAASVWCDWILATLNTQIMIIGCLLSCRASVLQFSLINRFPAMVFRSSQWSSTLTNIRSLSPGGISRTILVASRQYGVGNCIWSISWSWKTVNEPFWIDQRSWSGMAITHINRLGIETATRASKLYYLALASFIWWPWDMLD